MADVFHRTFFIDGPAGRIEAMLWTVADPEPRRVAIVCHPHPLFGGTMHNKVVYQTSKALHHENVPVLRFNFRGAGLSDGSHDKGRGEQDDLRAAIEYVTEKFAGKPILLAGFSFGAWVGLRVGCEDGLVKELIGLGLPADNSDLNYLRECIKPKLFIQGGNDQYGSRQNVEKLFATVSEPKRLIIIDGADHFFAGKLHQVGTAIANWLRELRT